MNILERWAMRVALRRLEGKMILGGWMGRIGAVGAMLGAIGAACADVASGHTTFERLAAYFAAFNMGLSNLGIRRKLDAPSKPGPDAPVGVPLK